jgi:repressor LexA
MGEGGLRVKKTSLSKRQAEILDFIKSEMQKKGYPPSVREIGKAVGLSSSSTVHSHLTALERKGYVRRDPSKPRALEVLDFRATELPITSKKIRNIPLVGRIAAGKPLLAQENIEDTFPLPVDFASDENCFMLRVQGESMVNAGIMPNDYVIVRQQSAADDGDIVVALIDDEATVKRFYRESDSIRLEAENPRMEPIRSRDVTVLGKVIGVVRRI